MVAANAFPTCLSHIAAERLLSPSNDLLMTQETESRVTLRRNALEENTVLAFVCSGENIFALRYTKRTLLPYTPDIASVVSVTSR